MNIAIDIGTCNTQVATKNKGVIISEPSVITYDTYTNSIIAVGDMAYKTIGKTPERVKATFPMVDGAVSASELMENMIRIFIEKGCRKRISMPKIITAVPGGITEVERRAIVNAISSYSASFSFEVNAWAVKTPFSFRLSQFRYFYQKSR